MFAMLAARKIRLNTCNDSVILEKYAYLLHFSLFLKHHLLDEA